jgi:hypothetical protein
MIVRDEDQALAAAHRLTSAVKGGYSLGDDALYAAKAEQRGSVHLQRCTSIQRDPSNNLIPATPA